MFSVAKSTLTSHLSRQMGTFSMVVGSNNHNVLCHLFALRLKQYPCKLKEAALKEKIASRHTKPTLDIAQAMPASPQELDNASLGALGNHAALKEKFASRDTKPTLDIAQAMPVSPQELDNASLVTLSALGDHAARKEILKRHIMTVDIVDYDGATKFFEEIAQTNKKGMFLLTLPYSIGIGVALTAGLASLPLVFDLTTAEWFNCCYVTTDVPEPEDLETCLEVGSWTWNWMQAPLGQISFFLLTLQYCRAQLDNLGLKPYTCKVKQWRGERLAKAFPKYDARLLIAYSHSATIYK